MMLPCASRSAPGVVTRRIRGVAPMPGLSPPSKQDPGVGAGTGHHKKRHARIVSQAPGRVRVRVDRRHRDPTVLGLIEARLTDQAGVEAVSTNARTGSVL